MNAHPTFAGKTDGDAALAAQLRSLAVSQDDGARTEVPRRRRGRIALLAVLLLAGSTFGVLQLVPQESVDRLIGFGETSAAPSGPPATPGPVATAPTTSVAAPRPETIVGTGRVVALRNVALSLERSGLVESVAAQVGDAVAAGDLLVALDLADAALAEREADLGLVEAQAALRLAVSERESAQEAVSRTQTLLSRGTGSRLALADAEQALEASQARVALARTGVERAELALARAGREIALRRLTAPFDGIVVARTVDPGAYALSPRDAGPDRGTAIVLMDPASRVIDVEIAQASIRRIALGAEGVAVLDADPDRELRVRVHSIAPVASHEKGTVTVRVEPASPLGSALPNMSARVRLVVPATVAATNAVETQKD